MTCAQKLILSCALALFPILSWSQNLDEKFLMNNLAYGQLIELNQYSPGRQKSLMLRLFATPASDEICGLETGCVFWSKSSTNSGRNNPLILVETIH